MNQESGKEERDGEREQRIKNNVNIKFSNSKQMYLYRYYICKLMFNIYKLKFYTLI